MRISYVSFSAYSLYSNIPILRLFASLYCSYSLDSIALARSKQEKKSPFITGYQIGDQIPHIYFSILHFARLIEIEALESSYYNARIFI
jgi:hypothetical protein